MYVCLCIFVMCACVFVYTYILCVSVGGFLMIYTLMCACVYVWGVGRLSMVGRYICGEWYVCLMGGSYVAHVLMCLWINGG